MSIIQEWKEKWIATDQERSDALYARDELRAALTAEREARQKAEADRDRFRSHMAADEKRYLMRKLSTALQELTAEREAHAETKAALQKSDEAAVAHADAFEQAMASRVVIEQALNVAQQETAWLREQLATEKRSTHTEAAFRELAESALVQMTRAWALAAIDTLWPEAHPTFLQGVLEGLPAPVAALVREHAGKPVGDCDRCGQRAPLRPEMFIEANLAGSKACAWGCTPKESK